MPENTWKTQSTLFLLSVPLLLFFLFGVYSFDIGNVPITSLFLLGILFAGMVHVRCVCLLADGDEPGPGGSTHHADLCG